MVAARYIIIIRLIAEYFRPTSRSTYPIGNECLRCLVKERNLLFPQSQSSSILKPLWLVLPCQTLPRDMPPLWTDDAHDRFSSLRICLVCQPCQGIRATCLGHTCSIARPAFNDIPGWPLGLLDLRFRATVNASRTLGPWSMDPPLRRHPGCRLHRFLELSPCIDPTLWFSNTFRIFSLGSQLWPGHL